MEPPLPSRMGASLKDSFSPLGGYPALGNYYLVFWRFALAQLGWGIIPVTVLLFIVPDRFRIWVALYLIFKVAVGCVLSALVVSRYYPVQVSAAGIRARDLGGVAVRLRWEQISSVVPITLIPAAPYVRISTPTKKHAVYLPLFLRDREGFIAHVLVNAPADNALRLFLEGRYR